MIAFGPVPSRRLGRSLGINHIPPKACTFGCVYCQVGPTLEMRTERREFYPPEEVLHSVENMIGKARSAGEEIDFLTLVPDGEPTLDLHLGRLIRSLKPLGYPVAVITNASLLWREEVRGELAAADWVSLKVDAAREPTWRRINRPHGNLSLPVVLEGLRAFSRGYSGRLVTETLLVDGLNDGPADLEATAAFLGELRPETAYLSVPTRPPAESWVKVPDPAGLLRAYEILARHLPRSEYLIGDEGPGFSALGEAAESLLATLAVHPMREKAVERFLERAGTGAGLTDRLVEAGLISRVDYLGTPFFVKRPASRSR